MGDNSGNCPSAMTSSRLALKVLVITMLFCGTIAFTATPATPATDMVVTENQATMPDPCEPSPSPSPTPSEYAINHCGNERECDPDGDEYDEDDCERSKNRRPQQQRLNAAQRAQRDQVAVDATRRRSGGATRRRRDSLSGVFG